jgi:hypothetical protein
MRITGIAQPHRAFRQSADAKLTVPFVICMPIRRRVEARRTRTAGSAPRDI